MRRAISRIRHDLAEEQIGTDALLAIDRVDEADSAAAGRMFTLFNALQERHGRMIVAHARAAGKRLTCARTCARAWAGASCTKCCRSPTRTSRWRWLRTRESADFRFSGDVIDYLLRHGRRDMRSLLATLAALDRRSLATKRPITVPMIREWLQQELEWERRGNG